MDNQLFRRESILNRQEADGGRPVQASMPEWRTVGWALAITLFLVIGFTGFVHYNQKVRVSGVLAPLGGLIELPAATAGTVRIVHHRQGEHVRAGDPIIELSAEGLDATAQVERERRELAEEAELAMLDTNHAVQQQALRERESSFVTRLASLRADHESLLLERDLQANRTELDVAQLPRLAELSKRGMISKRALVEAQGQDLNNRAIEQRLDRQLRAVQREMSDTERAINELPNERARTEETRIRRRNELQQSLSTLMRQQNSVLRAPTDGVLVALLVEPGQSLEHGRVVATLARADRALQGLLMMPASSPGQISAGDEVVMRLPAFPYQRFGHFRGTVLEVGDTVLSPKQLSDSGLGAGASAPMYRVVVSLDVRNVIVDKQSFSLRAGMLVDADIVLQRRRMIDWLLEPLRAAKSRALHG